MEPIDLRRKAAIFLRCFQECLVAHHPKADVRHVLVLDFEPVRLDSPHRRMQFALILTYRENLISRNLTHLLSRKLHLNGNRLMTPSRPYKETLESLSITLQKLEQTSDPASDEHAVAEPKRILLGRIADLEALNALQSPATQISVGPPPPQEIIASSEPVQGVGPESPLKTSLNLMAMGLHFPSLPCVSGDETEDI